MEKKIKVKITREENATFFKASIGDVVETDFEQYVKGVVASEVGNSHIEACQAQAVAARTFAWNACRNGSAISDSSSVAQAFRASRSTNSAYKNAHDGVETTRGQLLYYDGKPLATCSYSANNGGRTVSAQERWGGVRPYLIAKNDPWDTAVGTGRTGHGVGLSQRGAKYAASIGVGYKEILAFYYDGTELRENYGEPSTTEKEVGSVGKFKASWAVQYAEDAYRGKEKNNGGGYIWGSRGNLCDQKFLDQQAKNHSDQASTILGAGKKWIGHYVWDCSGLWRGLVYSSKEVSYSGKYTGGSNGMWNSWATEKGKIDAMPHLPGIAVFHYKDGNYHHVGIYIGKGIFIDFRGTAYGGKRGDYSTYQWTHWAKLDCVEYDIPLEDNLLGPIIGSGFPVITIPDAPIGTVEVISPKWLNIRAAKSKSSKDLGDLKGGTLIEYYSDDGTWLTIKHNGTLAYCMKEFTKEVQDNSEENIEDAPQFPKTMTITVPKAPLNVRTLPNTGSKSKILASLAKGTKVVVLTIEGTWAKIQWAGSEAWCSANYLA